MIKTQGIILKRADIREADRMYSAYTEDGGKVSVLAKGAGKIRSKMAGHLEPFSFSSLMIAPGKNVNHLAGASLIKDFPRLRASWEKLAAAGRGLDTVDRLTRWEQPAPEIFNLLLSFLEKLEASEDGQNYNFIFAAFAIKLLALLGYAPELYRCVVCKKKITPEKIFFSAEQGGLVCPVCAAAKFTSDEAEQDRKEIYSARLTSPEAVKVLRLFLKKSSSFSGRIKANKKSLQEVIGLAEEYLGYYFDQTPLKLKG